MGRKTILARYKGMAGRIASALATTLLAQSFSMAQFEGAEPPPPSLATGFESISQEQARRWVGLLAGPVFEGRGTGQIGYMRAAHWVAGQAAEFGLEPMGDGGTYFQMLPIDRLIVDSMHSHLQLPNGLAHSLQDKIGLFNFQNRPEVQGALSILRIHGNPAAVQESLIRDRFVIYSAPAERAPEISVALEKMRPAAMLRLIDSPAIQTPQLKRPPRGVAGTHGTIQRDFFREIAKSLDLSTDWLSADWIDQPRPGEAHSNGELPRDLPDVEVILDSPLEMSLQLRFREESIAVPNVVAWLPGEDPTVNHEYVVIGAHLDHLGKQGPVYYPGADDNASGSAALLAIARAMSLNPVRPKRSVLFSWFAAEEMGLVGSGYYCNNPSLPLDRMCCMLNLDMVGRNEENAQETSQDNYKSMHLVGTQKGSPLLHEMVLEANKRIGFDFEFDEERVFLRSDQASFFKSGVSVGFLFGGFHPDYHALTDTPDKVNYQKLVSAAKLWYLVSYAIADHGRLSIPPTPVPPSPASSTGVIPTGVIPTGGNASGPDAARQDAGSPAAP